MPTNSLADCKRCKRLANFLKEVKLKYPDYHCQPVPSFGDPDAQLLIVGLAPGLHGANATGKPFIGDQSGVLLYKTLFQFGFADTADTLNIDDELQLLNCRISNAVKCLPPQNKPTTDETKRCTDNFLKYELKALPKGAIIPALGSIAHNAVLRTFGKKLSAYKFAHNALYDLENDYYLLDSYHCSRYNTQTKRLTESMFNAVFERVQKMLAGDVSSH